MTKTEELATWRASHQDFADEIYFSPEALRHLQGYRQLSCLAKEAGGQLFGRRIEAGLKITSATGPYKGDARTRTSYRSNPREANRMIDFMRQKGFIYLGEWHTHPERHPRPSGSDIEAFGRLCENSEHASETLILVIQGLLTVTKGLAVLTLDGSRLTPWSIGVESPHKPSEKNCTKAD